MSTKNNQKRRGRPPLDVKRDHPIAIRCNELEFQAAHELATKDEVSISVIGRRALKQYLQRRGALPEAG